jgi:hypothetical protein
MQEVSRDASVSMGDEPPAAGAAREIGDMSSDLLQKVLVTLTPEQVSNAAMVSRRWHTVGTCNDVWRRHCEAAWPSLVTQAEVLAGVIERAPIGHRGYYHKLFRCRQEPVYPAEAPVLKVRGSLDDYTFLFDISCCGSSVFSRAVSAAGVVETNEENPFIDSAQTEHPLVFVPTPADRRVEPHPDSPERKVEYAGALKHVLGIVPAGPSFPQSHWNPAEINDSITNGVADRHGLATAGPGQQRDRGRGGFIMPDNGDSLKFSIAQLAGRAEKVPGGDFEVIVTVMRNSDGQLSQLMRLGADEGPGGGHGRCSGIWCPGSDDTDPVYNPSRDRSFEFDFDTDDLPLRSGAETAEGQVLRPGSLLFMDHCDDPTNTENRCGSGLRSVSGGDAPMRWGCRLYVKLQPCAMLRRKPKVEGADEIYYNSSDGTWDSISEQERNYSTLINHELTRHALPEMPQAAEDDEEDHSTSIANESLGNYSGVLLRPRLQWELMRWEDGRSGNNGTSAGPSNLLRLLEHGLVWK